MKKLKISELPICSTLVGLFTIGVDNLNRSVKVSLQFVEDKVTEAVSKAMAATTSANSAAQAAQTAKTATETATAQAQAATADVLAKIAILIPSALTVEAPRRITWGNMERFVIKTVLSPVTAMRNLIFISDNKAVEVSTDGVLTPVAKGVSRVHVIPTQNTALARTCVIEVGDPRLRLSSQTALRFTQAGGLRLT